MAATSNGNGGAENEKTRKTYYSRLFRRFVLMTMICSIAPLLLVGWAINIHYTRFAENRAIESFKTQLEHHRTIIDLFLKERTTKLYVVAKTFTRDQLTAPLKLNEIFEIVNRKDGSFTDLGVISEKGNHLAYVGPFDLMDKNYFNEFWFKEVMRQDYTEALEAVDHANLSSLIGLHLSALIILVVTVLVTRHMISVIKKRNLEADQLNKQYMQASKLAAIGELSSGVAHEINNPLAIILTERQILLDMANSCPAAMDQIFKPQFLDSMAQISVQIERCKRITHNLLRFARRTQSIIEPMGMNLLERFKDRARSKRKPFRFTLPRAILKHPGMRNCLWPGLSLMP